MKAVVFLNNIVPYHDARWRSASRLLSQCVLVEITNCDEFKTLEVTLKSAGSYERVTLFPGVRLEDISKKLLSEAIKSLLDRENPEVIFVNGYSFFYNWIALEWGLVHGVPVVICSESNEHDEPRDPLKEMIKRFFVSRCGAGLAGGIPQASYLEKLGIPRERLFTGYDVVDNDHFTGKGMKGGAGEETLRKTLGLPEHYFFACARFGKKKNIPRLISAYALFCNQFSADTVPHLVIAGEGGERALIEQTISVNHLSGKVHLIGPKGYDDLPSYYALADAFVHASTTEQWGLVVNEAMASGLPVLVSNRCGCAPDLVQEGVNGWSFDPADGEQLATLMMKISTDSSLRKGMGERSREIIGNWGKSRFARGAIASAKASLSGPGKEYGLRERLMFMLMALR